MKLKHWMESFSRARKKSKNDNADGVNSSSEVSSPSPIKSRTRKLSVKDIMMPHHIPRERKYVRDNYPAVAAYLDHRNPLSSIQNLRTFRQAVPVQMPTPPHYYDTAKKTQNMVKVGDYGMIYDTPTRTTPGGQPQQACACFRHQQSECINEDSASSSGTLNAKRQHIRTNPWIRPQNTMTSSSETSSCVSENARIPPPKPQRKRPPPVEYTYSAQQLFPGNHQEDEMDDVICSDKSVGTDGDEYLLEDCSEYCDCEDCACSSSSCHSFSSLKLSSSAAGFSFSSETIQPSDDSESCSLTSTPTILNDFDGDEEGENEENDERDSAVDSPGSALNNGARAAVHSNARSHFSPADSHTSWKYFDDDDEVDSGHGQTASSLGSPGSAEDYNNGYSNKPAATSLLHGRTKNRVCPKRVLVDENEENDLDTNIEIIRTRLQKQVYQLKHEETALDRQMERSREFYGGENMIEEDFIVQKKAILVETLGLLKRQLDEQNDRLRVSYSALQNLHKHQVKRQEPRNRDCRALCTLYNESLRETFC